MKKLFNIFLLFLGFTLSFAQQYPVRLIPVVIPPYSLKLGDYATSTDNKLQLQVLMTDLMEPQHQTGIKFSLQAGLNAVPFAQSNDFVVGMQPFMLYPGSNITLTNVDLRALFELQNLNGINANQYAQPLSDGVYQFCFQAYDFYTKNNLSQKTCATVFLTQYDPPMLNLPQNAEKVQAVSPYSGGAGIVFQWMPRQIAPNTKYIFTLKELWDSGQSPISGFLSSPPLWREETYAPTLYYGIDKTQLMPGKRYAWQVQAKSGNPVVGANPTDDNGVYKNNGLSEIFFFDYVENCALPTLLMAKNAGRGRVELSWNLAGQPSGLYTVQYRKRGSTSQWQTEKSYQPKYIITGLEDQTEYEYRIGSVCGNLQTFNNTNPITDGDSAGNAYAYSGVQYFTTDSKDKTNQNYQCGVMPAVDIANKSPLQSLLGANEVFTAGDFPVTVISAQGSNGIYSGTGYIVVPYLADTKVKVSFNNIKLNTDKKLIEGVVETTYDPNESAVAYASSIVGETFGDQGVKEVTVDYNISDIKYTATPPPGKITIIGDAGGGSGNGGGSQQDLVGGKDYQIKDKDGNIWNVDENGNVTKGGKVAESGASNATNTDGITGSGSSATINQYTAKGIKIEWKENAGGQFAYDTQEKTKLPADKYSSVKDANGTTVYVPYKATVKKQTELFDAKVSITDPALKDAKIEFKTLSIGKAIDATEINKTDTERNYQLKLVGAFDYAEEEVIAVLMPKDSTAKQQVISSFRLVHLSPKDINVALVPTDAESKKELSNIETQTNAIYKKVGVKINFNRDDVFDIAPYLNGSTVIPTEKNTALSTYSSVQQSINKGYGNKNSDRYILFVADRNSDKAGQLGYMRLNGQFGYVFKEGLSLTKTGAHELGHGIFKLEHPFENLGVGEKTTPLLMDYRTGDNDIVLSHLDWKQINDPAFKLYAFQSQSSGESVDGATFVLENAENFITPDGKLLSLPKGAIIYQYCLDINVSNNDSYGGFPNGALYGFKIGEEYYTIKNPKSSGTNFQGYFLVENGQYKDKQYPITNEASGKKDIVFLNYTAKVTEPHYVNFVKINDFEYASSNQSKFVYPNYFDKFSSSNIIESIDFSSIVCSSSDFPQREKGNTKVKQSDRKFIDTVGNTSNERYKIEVYKNEKTGKYEVEVELTGTPKNSKVAEQKTAIKQQIKKLAEEKLNELGGLNGSKSVAVNPNITDADFGFYVKAMNGKEWLQTIGELGTNVWEDAALPKNYWKEDEAGHKNSTIKTPALFAGVSDGGIDLVSDYPQLIKLGYDVATKAEVRTGIWSSIIEISPSSVKTMASDAIKQKVDAYNFSDKPYLGYHELGKDGVTVVSAIMGAGFLKAGDKALENATKTTGEKIKDAIKNKLDDIEKHFDSKEFKDLLEDKFRKYKARAGDLAIDEAVWQTKYKTLYKNREIGKLTEKTFQELEGGMPKTFKFQGEVRKVDNVLGTTAKEIKSGKLKGSEFIDNQLRKDLMMLGLDDVPIKKIEWHLFDGADASMIEKLEKLRNTFGKEKFDFIIY